jgi:hypothetical protein
MIVLSGLGSSLVITQGYGRKYINPFVSIGNFEKSFYKFIKEEYADLSNYSVYYGEIAVDPNEDNIWLDCRFPELNVETGKFSIATIDVVTRILSVDDFNTQLSMVVDDLMDVLTSADIDLYDFTYPENPQRFLDKKIVTMHLGRQTFESITELEFKGNKSLLQSIRVRVKMKLLENYSRTKVV